MAGPQTHLLLFDELIVFPHLILSLFLLPEAQFSKTPELGQMALLRILQSKKNGVGVTSNFKKVEGQDRRGAIWAFQVEAVATAENQI